MSSILSVTKTSGSVPKGDGSVVTFDPHAMAQAALYPPVGFCSIFEVFTIDGPGYYSSINDSVIKDVVVTPGTTSAITWGNFIISGGGYDVIGVSYTGSTNSHLNFRCHLYPVLYSS